MKKIILAAAVAAAFAGGLARAQDKKPDHEVSFNASVVTDYRYRGISQTRLKPALQGGADYVNNPTGFYLGTWLSTIRWIKDVPGGDAGIEWDIYGGKRGEIVEGVSYDIGVLRYQYPSNNLAPSANTTEIYGQLGYGPAYLKYSHSLTNLFGFVDSKRSGYLDIGANIEVGEGLVLNLHAGHQKVRNNSPFSYTDWKVGLTKDFGIASGSLALIGTDTDNYVGPNGKNLGKNSLVLSVSKTF
ncbi:MAG TPA: TorF family putative porin [Noviherbaspirillum sp.]|uniref:TorF family putative porin n=1 Tax=Noviherbaspirillum sp. TaxID=1926288 RepID=UPI002D75462E|nr:TorF family putative porin [Noviherbaspirillum sp.]HYD95136.1 TorF family putative porin [Noviherbaspirillum sp.]